MFTSDLRNTDRSAAFRPLQCPSANGLRSSPEHSSAPELKRRERRAPVRTLGVFAALLVATLTCSAQTNSPGTNTTAASTNQSPTLAERSEKIRATLIEHRRVVCGRVLKVFPDGVVVESGYTELLKPPFNQSWWTSGGAKVERDSKALEINEPGSACIGLVFLTDIPKRPRVQQYDYVALQAYPAGEYQYTSVPGVQKTLRKFSAGLDTAVRLKLEDGEK